MKPQAKILKREQMLVLTLPDAVTPAVWQLDLAATRASVIEVVASGDAHILRFKNTMTGATQDIAVYQTRDHAVRVLMLTHTALAGGPGMITRLLKYLGYFVAAAMASLLLWVILGAIMYGISSHPDAPKVIERPAAGVPQSADEVLMGTDQ